MPASFSLCTSRSWCSREGDGHGVELPRQRPELVGRVRRRCGCRGRRRRGGPRPRCSRAMGRAMERPMYRLTAPASERCGHQQRPGARPWCAAPPRPRSARAAAMRRLRAGDEALGQVLDAGDDELGPGVLLLHEGPVAERTTAGTMPCRKIPSSSPLARSMSSTAESASGEVERACAAPRQLEHAPLGLGVEAEVARVADDDGVGLVGVLVAHRARELERHPDALLLVLRPCDRSLDASQPGHGEPRGEPRDQGQGSEPDEQATRRSGPVLPHPENARSNARASGRPGDTGSAGAGRALIGAPIR